MNTLKVGRWEIPSELFERYLKVVESTERSSVRYNYEFDDLRRSIHDKIINHVGLMVHMEEYRDFQRALQDLCDEMLPTRFTPQHIPKTINSPKRGLTI